MKRVLAIVAGIASAIVAALTFDLHTAITRWLWGLP